MILHGDILCDIVTDVWDPHLSSSRESHISATQCHGKYHRAMSPNLNRKIPRKARDEPPLTAPLGTRTSLLLA